MSKRYKKNPPAPATSAVHATVTPPATGVAADTQTRTQRMARAALDCVKPLVGDPLATDYKPRAMSFPTQVLQSGLAQAIGFLAAKSGGTKSKEKAYARYFEHVAKVTGHGNGNALLEDALKADLPRYRLLTREVLDASAWLKRFTQSLISDPDTKE